MTTGKQAKAYADHFIAVHLEEAAGGQTYSEVSGQYLAQCSDPAAAKSASCQQLASQKVTLFQGETLRGLLLYGYAFATMGTIAGYAASAAFVGAVLLSSLCSASDMPAGFANRKLPHACPLRVDGPARERFCR